MIKKEEGVVSEQAPPAAKQKKNPTGYHCQMIKKKKGNNKRNKILKVKPEIRQASEFEKKEIIDTNQIPL